MAFTPDEIENLSALMLAPNNDSTSLAFTILETQPFDEFPKELITEFFVVYKMSKKTEFEDKAKKILDTFGSAALHKSLKRKFDLGQGTAVEPTIEKSITKFISGTELDGVKFAKALFNKYDSGILYLLNNLPEKELKSFLGQFTNGTSFSLTKRELDTLPKIFYEYKDLQEIDLSGNKLGTIYKEFKIFTELRSLNFSGNKLKNIPKDIAKLSKLEKLNISNNLFPKFPDTIGDMQTLKELNIAECGGYWPDEMVFPETFYKLKQLRKFTISSDSKHCFRQYPLFRSVVGEGENGLDLNPMPMALLAWKQNKEAAGYIFEHGNPQQINEAIKHFYDEKTKTLDLTSSPIKYLPKELAEWDILHLNMHRMGIGYSNHRWCSNVNSKDMLKHLKYMPNLESIDFRGNVIRNSMPEEFYALKNLKNFKASFSHEDKLPGDIQKRLPDCVVESGH